MSKGAKLLVYDILNAALVIKRLVINTLFNPLAFSNRMHVALN